MGLFDKLFKVNEQKLSKLNLSSDEAFIAIIFSAIAVDEEINRDEMKLLGFILSKFKGLASLTPLQFQNLVNRFQKIIKNEGVGNLVAAAKENLSHDLRATAFANAVDLVLSDGILNEQEKEFLENLQKTISIDDALAEQIINVIVIKNKGSTADIFVDTHADSMFM